MKSIAAVDLIRTKSFAKSNSNDSDLIDRSTMSYTGPEKIAVPQLVRLARELCTSRECHRANSIAADFWTVAMSFNSLFLDTAPSSLMLRPEIGLTYEALRNPYERLRDETQKAIDSKQERITRRCKDAGIDPDALLSASSADLDGRFSRITSLNELKSALMPTLAPEAQSAPPIDMDELLATPSANANAPTIKGGRKNSKSKSKSKKKGTKRSPKSKSNPMPADDADGSVVDAQEDTVIDNRFAPLDARVSDTSQKSKVRVHLNSQRESNGSAGDERPSLGPGSYADPGPSRKIGYAKKPPSSTQGGGTRQLPIQDRSSHATNTTQASSSNNATVSHQAPAKPTLSTTIQKPREKARRSGWDEEGPHDSGAQRPSRHDPRHAAEETLASQPGRKPAASMTTQQSERIAPSTIKDSHFPITGPKHKSVSTVPLNQPVPQKPAHKVLNWSDAGLDDTSPHDHTDHTQHTVKADDGSDVDSDAMTERPDDTEPAEKTRHVKMSRRASDLGRRGMDEKSLEMGSGIPPRQCKSTSEDMSWWGLAK